MGMLKVEDYCIDTLRASVLHLTTHDQQVFYSRCGYTFSQPVCAFGGSSKLKMDMFSKLVVPPVINSPDPPSKSDTKSSQNEDLKQSNQKVGVPPPPPPGPPPPPPPGPPTPSVSTRVSSNDVVTPDSPLLSACAKTLSSPSLADVAARLAPKLLTIEQEGVPKIDSASGKGKNTEDTGGKMCMSKKLL